jgi:protein-L-isoaspartate(D-aspartate) O-methyltransferase
MSDSGPGRGPRFPLALNRVKAASGSGSRELLRPQRPLQHAAQHAQGAARQGLPTGVGLDSSAVRQRMVQRLRQQGVQHDALLAALAAVPRHLFVDSALVGQAYEDTSLPIGHGQTISKPSVVARMIELLLAGAGARARGHLGRTLEIGTGCGYQAAVLAALSPSVVSIERVGPLHDKARANITAPWRARVRLVHGDGMLGHGPNAPYDSIIAAAGGEQVPAAWLDQLAVGGRLVAPVHSERGGQVLLVAERTEQGIERQLYEAVMFVPLKSGLA